jgi:AcrR family transcriptional regulator
MRNALPRTLDPTAFAIRRDAFLDAAQMLMQTKGFDQMSLQDVLDQTHASKGAFYHYFGSKTDLLDAIVERMVDAAVAQVSPGIDDADRTALEKLEGFFGDLAAFKLERRELILGFMRSWLSDDNAIVREHHRRGLVGRLQPVMTAIVSQGVAEGVFQVSSPETTARVLVSLIQGLTDDATGLWLALDDGTISIDYMEMRLTSYVEAFDRILGAKPGSVKLGDMSVLRDWHEWNQTYRKEHP